MLPIETENPMFGLYLYPTAKEIMEKQQDVSWTAQEIPVEKDKPDYKGRLNELQLNGVTITLQTFVEIEQTVGEVWGQIASWYPHSEIEGCATEISRMEKSVHAFFYQKMSDVLNIPPEEIQKNQQTIKVLKDKLTFLKEITSNLDRDKLLSLATVTGIEQVLLFSNFGFLKSFKSNGYKYIMNTLTGVDFVIQDEQIHGVFAAYLHNTHIDELKAAKPDWSRQNHDENVKRVIQEIVSHEDDVIDYMFPGDVPINSITGSQLKTFIRSRANDVLNDLNIESIFEIDENPIAEWFYKGSKSIRLHDFFVSGTAQYSRKWQTNRFSRLQFLKANNNE